ncbi:MAG TPA: cation:proton antiporter [Planctomycetes bacterium]|nr:cation:proton antiporter [Planctomycetota bacterium]
MTGLAPFVLCLVLFLVGLYGVLSQKNLIKIIIGLAISGNAVNLFLILLGYRSGGLAPIRTLGIIDGFAASAVDPLPQAMVLTAIVIDLGVLALLVSIAMRLHQRYGSYDVTEIKKLKG